MKINFERYGNGNNFTITNIKLNIRGEVEYVNMYSGKDYAMVGCLSSDNFKYKFWE